MTRLLKALLTLVALGVAALPAVVFVSCGWYNTSVFGDPAGKGSGAIVLLVLFYVIWLPGTVFGLIWVFDRVGIHYAVDQSPRRQREPRRKRCRQRAGLELLASQQRARDEAERAAADKKTWAPAERGQPGRMSPPDGRPGDDTGEHVPRSGAQRADAVPEVRDNSAEQTTREER